MSQRHKDTTPLPPSSKEFLEDMRKAKEEKEEKEEKKVFFHYPRNSRAEILYIPCEKFSARPITYVRDLDEGVYRLVEVIQNRYTEVLKLEDKNGVLHYVEDEYDTLVHVRPQSLVYIKKYSRSFIVKDSVGYYILRKSC